jgi:hypothetical protein
LVGSSEAKKVPGLVRFLFNRGFGEINRAFELPSPRNAQKRDKQNREKIGFGLFCRFFGKNLSTRFF